MSNSELFIQALENNDINKLIAQYKNVHKKIAQEIDFKFQVGLSRHVV